MAEYDGSRFALQYRPTNPEAVNQSVREGLMMPLTAYENRRHHEDEMGLSQQRLTREVQRDERNAGREDQSLALRREESLRSDKRAGQREDLYRTQENRREQQAMFERQHMQSLEDEALFRQLQNATTPWEAEAAAQALERKGYSVRRPDSESPALPPLAPVAPAAPPAPMSKGDAETSAALDKADAKYSKGLGVKAGLGGRATTRAPKPAANNDADLAAQLDAADQTYSRGLGVAPGGLGGAPLAPRRQSLDVPLSDAMLNPDDPYNRLVR